MNRLHTQAGSRVRALVRRWESIQVELHGRYSVERFVSMQQYRESTSTWCSLLVLLAIPLFPLGCVAVVDAFPLESPDLGLKHTGTLWIRGVLVGFLDSYALVWMFSRYVPELKLSKLTLLSAAIAATAALHITALCLMVLLWYPLPFTLFWTTGPWLGTLALSLKVARGEFLRCRTEALNEVRRFSTILIVTTSTAVIYTAFNIIFQTVSIEWQSLAALTIPVFRIAQKNLFCRFLRGKDDLKPEMVTLNVDVANALFISSTMENLQSIKSSAMLVVLDFMQMLTSLSDLKRMLKEIRDITNEETDQAIARALMIASKYPELAKQPTTSLSLRSNYEISRVSTLSKIRDITNAMAKNSNSTQVAPSPVESSILPDCCLGGTYKSPTLLLSKGVAGVSSRTVEKRHLLLQNVLQLTFFMEFFLLSELMKALTPLTYTKDFKALMEPIMTLGPLGRSISIKALKVSAILPNSLHTLTRSISRTVVYNSTSFRDEIASSRLISPLALKSAQAQLGPQAYAQLHAMRLGYILLVAAAMSSNVAPTAESAVTKASGVTTPDFKSNGDSYALKHGTVFSDESTNDISTDDSNDEEEERGAPSRR
ncbi:hypothetical protein ON010_g1837 [Phytophthora cinnamomi]|nr:hypothetical protein ON010_g1837 [Phytophthora cinnamomi]